jgi:hypothetical protein
MRGNRLGAQLGQIVAHSEQNQAFEANFLKYAAPPYKNSIGIDLPIAASGDTVPAASAPNIVRRLLWPSLALWERRHFWRLTSSMI